MGYHSLRQRRYILKPRVDRASDLPWVKRCAKTDTLKALHRPPRNRVAVER